MTYVPSQPPYPAPPSQFGLRPHRGTMILVFGILGLVLCVIFGIVAWVMGSNDLREMAAGRMDRNGEGLTRAGQICGMISVGLVVLGLVVWVVIMIIAIVGAGIAGAAGAGGP